MTWCVSDVHVCAQARDQGGKAKRPAPPPPPPKNKNILSSQRNQKQAPLDKKKTPIAENKPHLPPKDKNVTRKTK